MDIIAKKAKFVISNRINLIHTFKYLMKKYLISFFCKITLSLVAILTTLVFNACSGGDSNVLKFASDDTYSIIVGDLGEICAFYGVEYNESEGTLTFSEEMNDAISGLGGADFIKRVEDVKLKGLGTGRAMWLSEKPSVMFYDNNQIIAMTIVFPLADKDAFLSSLKDYNAELSTRDDYDIATFDKVNCVVLAENNYGWLLMTNGDCDKRQLVKYVDKIKDKAESAPLKQWKKDFFTSDNVVISLTNMKSMGFGIDVDYIGSKMTYDKSSVECSIEALDSDGASINFSDTMKYRDLDMDDLAGLADGTQLAVAFAMPEIDFSSIERKLKQVLLYNLDAEECDRIISVTKSLKSVCIGVGRESDAPRFSLLPASWTVSGAMLFKDKESSQEVITLIKNYIDLTNNGIIERWRNLGLGNYSRPLPHYTSDSAGELTVYLPEFKPETVKFKVEGKRLLFAYNTEPSLNTGFINNNVAVGNIGFFGVAIPSDSPLGKTLDIPFSFDFSALLQAGKLEYYGSIDSKNRIFLANILMWINRIKDNSSQYIVSDTDSSDEF